MAFLLILSVVCTIYGVLCVNMDSRSICSQTVHDLEKQLLALQSEVESLGNTGLKSEEIELVRKEVGKSKYNSLLE